MLGEGGSQRQCKVTYEQRVSEVSWRAVGRPKVRTCWKLE